MLAPAISVLLALGSGAAPSSGPGTIRATYTLSDGLGLIASIKLRQDGTFEYRWHGCTGPIAEAEGRYQASPQSVRFKPNQLESPIHLVTFADSMLRVKWGGREYLIPEARALAFVNAINAGQEPRSGDFGKFYLRTGDEKIAVTGSPDLPSEWLSFLLPSPLKGRVLVVLQHETATTRPIVVLDAGTDAGLRPGMELFASNARRPNFSARLVIQTATSHRAEAVVSFQHPSIKPGDSWSTRSTR